MLGARVGAGKYSYAVNPFAASGGDVFALLCQLTVEFSDGSNPLVLATTDTPASAGWQSQDSPIVWENLYNGVVFDARLDLPNWAAPSDGAAGNDGVAQWGRSVAVDIAPEIILPVGAHATLSARLFPPIRVVEVHIYVFLHLHSSCDLAIVWL